jgi:hypothetical protein
VGTFFVVLLIVTAALCAWLAGYAAYRLLRDHR